MSESKSENPYVTISVLPETRDELRALADGTTYDQVLREELGLEKEVTT